MNGASPPEKTNLIFVIILELTALSLLSIDSDELNKKNEKTIAKGTFLMVDYNNNKRQEVKFLKNCSTKIQI